MIRYRTGFKDIHNKHRYIADIHDSNYTDGDVEELVCGANGIVITHSDIDFDFEPLQPSSLRLTLVIDANNNVIRTLQDADPLSISIRVYRDGAAYWAGWLDPEQVEEPYLQGGNYYVELMFGDLNPLRSIPIGEVGRVRNADAIAFCLGALGLSTTMNFSVLDLKEKIEPPVSQPIRPTSKRRKTAEIPKAPTTWMNNKWGSAYTGLGGLDERATAFDMLAAVVGSWGCNLVQRMGRWWLYDGARRDSLTACVPMRAGMTSAGRRITRATYTVSAKTNSRKDRYFVFSDGAGKLMHNYIAIDGRVWVENIRSWAGDYTNVGTVERTSGILLRNEGMRRYEEVIKSPIVKNKHITIERKCIDTLTPIKIEVSFKGVKVGKDETNLSGGGRSNGGRYLSTVPALDAKGNYLCLFATSAKAKSGEMYNGNSWVSSEKNICFTFAGSYRGEKTSSIHLLGGRATTYITLPSNIEPHDKITIDFEACPLLPEGEVLITEVVVTQEYPKGAMSDDIGIDKVAVLKNSNGVGEESYSISRIAGQLDQITTCSLDPAIKTPIGSLIFERAMMYRSKGRRYTIDTLSTEIYQYMTVEGNPSAVLGTETNLYTAETRATLREIPDPTDEYIVLDTETERSLHKVKDAVIKGVSYLYAGEWVKGGSYAAYSEVESSGLLYRTDEATTGDIQQKPWRLVGLSSNGSVGVCEVSTTNSTEWLLMNNSYTATFSATLLIGGEDKTATLGRVIKRWRWTIGGAKLPENDKVKYTDTPTINISLTQENIVDVNEDSAITVECSPEIEFEK